MSVNGEQLELSHGEYQAVVTEVGAALRELSHAGRDLVVGFGADELRPIYRGAVLAPWPNRLADGRYEFGGEAHQLPLNEPDRGVAIHGLVAWERWSVGHRSADRVVLHLDLVPQHGYPFELAFTATYALGENGLSWELQARNSGERAAPYGCGPHPYLVGGAGRVDEWTLDVAASSVLEAAEPRLLPTRRLAVDAAGVDFRGGRPVGGAVLNHAFTDLAADADGLTTLRVAGPDGHGAQLRWDPAVCPWAQVYTTDLPGKEAHRAGLAVEPMTCPADAFNSGTDLVVLEPGQTHVARWELAAF